MAVGTSLLLIAIGAILAVVVGLGTIGGILIAIGVLGLVLSLAYAASEAPFPFRVCSVRARNEPPSYGHGHDHY